MSEMVERVAKAICELRPLFGPYYRYAEHYRPLARAAIAAMCDPTDAMVNESNDMDDAATIWRTMIEAALK